jgi:rhomboid protease GluP
MGYFVSSYFGWVTFPIVAILMGAVINFIIVTSSIGDVGILGASGIVYWLWGFWLMMYFLIERKVTVTRRIMKIVAISLMVLVPTSYNPQTSYFAHFLGLILGLAIGTTHFFFNMKYFRSYERYEIIATELDESSLNEDEEDNPPLYYH